MTLAWNEAFYLYLVPQFKFSDANMSLLVVGFIFCGLVVALISTKIQPALLFVGAACICMFLGYIPAEKLLQSYANETLVALILLLMVSSAIEKSAFIPLLARKVFVPNKRSLSLFRLSALVMLLSSHLNNTAVVASMLGLVRNNKYFSPSKLLIPLSYAAIMGGVLTLIGTSTNLIINSFIVDKDLPSLGFYDFFKIGLPVVFFGGIYIIFILPRLLPDLPVDEMNKVKEYFLEVRVGKGAKLIGKSIAENGLRNLENLFLGEIVRGDKLLSPITPGEILKEGDRLVFTGDITQIQELRKFDGLVILETGLDELLESNLQEVVIRHNSPILGRKIKDAQFRTKFDALVVGVNRGREKLSGKLGQIDLRTGDQLILAVGEDFAKHHNIDRNFIVISPIQPDSSLNYRESYLAISLFLGGILAVAFNLLSLFQSMTLLLFTFMVLNLLKIKDLKNNLNMSLLLMIGSSLGLAKVLVDLGLADKIGGGITEMFGQNSPYAALIGIYLATVLLTELVTNNAAAALIFPIAFAMSEELGVSYLPFVMAVAYGASASFLTPIGYQTNTMVWGLGKYRFQDYLRGGWPLTLMYGVIVLGLLPYFFPF
ncbi:MAG: SLC13 family permease [Bacteroidia bacterium]|nr:SLC13 family permease [Bacteroidia bacterium]